MITRLKFYVKRTMTDKLIVHSICRSTKSDKYLFRAKHRRPEDHLKFVQDAIAKKNPRSKAHVDVSLNDAELYTYVCATTGRFIYKKKLLERMPAKAVTSDPSRKLIIKK